MATIELSINRHILVLSLMPQVVKKIRWMIHNDIQEVLRIDWASFEFPYNENDLVKCLRQQNSIGMVAEDENGKIVGFMIYEYFNSRIHLLKIAVSPLERRQGIGRQMLRALKAKLTPQHRNRVLLKICETNIDAQLFFRRQGYYCVSTLKNYYQNSEVDAYVMQLRLNDALPA